MIRRDEYLRRLVGFKDKRLIKIVTGIRRCGKSTLFELYRDYLRENGVAGEQIIAINFEDPDFEELLIWGASWKTSFTWNYCAGDTGCMWEKSAAVRSILSRKVPVA
jgi:hypothetical protein